MADLNYSNIDRPYNTFMVRDTEDIPNIPNIENLTDGENAFNWAKSGGILSDVWLNTWMKSTDYKPKKYGFLIDGRKGYIECMQLFVGSGGIEGGSLHIPNRTDTLSWHVDNEGNMWSGADADNIGSAKSVIYNTGDAYFTDMTAVGGTITGALVRTGTGNIRAEMYGNDITLYDNSSGGGGVITGNAAGLIFTRSSGGGKDVRIQKRVSEYGTSGDTLEVFHQSSSDDGHSNRIVIGADGMSQTAYTDEVWLFGTTGISLSAPALVVDITVPGGPEDIAMNISPLGFSISSDNISITGDTAITGNLTTSGTITATGMIKSFGSLYALGDLLGEGNLRLSGSTIQLNGSANFTPKVIQYKNHAGVNSTMTVLAL